MRRLVEEFKGIFWKGRELIEFALGIDWDQCHLKIFLNLLSPSWPKYWWEPFLSFFIILVNTMHPPLLSTPLRTCPSKLATTLSYPEGNPTKSQPAVKRANPALQNALVPFGSRPHRRAVWWPWWLSGKESACQFRRCRFNPWAGKTPCRRKWQLTPVFLPGESHGQRSLAGYSPWGGKEFDMSEHAHKHTPFFKSSVSQDFCQWCLFFSQTSTYF